MIQPHNRHMSFSLYISALAVTDTIALLKGTEMADCKEKTVWLPQMQYICQNLSPQWN